MRFLGILEFEKYPHTYGNDIMGLAYDMKEDVFTVGPVTGDIEDMSVLFVYTHVKDNDDVLARVAGEFSDPFTFKHCTYKEACKIAFDHWKPVMDSGVEYWKPKEEEDIKFDLRPFFNKLKQSVK